MAAKNNSVKNKKSPPKNAQKGNYKVAGRGGNKKTSNKQTEKKKSWIEENRQKTAIILGGIAILFLAATLIKGEHIWLGLHNFIFGMFGITSFAWPLMLLYVTVVIASDRSMISARSNIIGASLFVLLLSGFVHLVSGTAGTSEIGEQFKTVWAMREEITLASGGVSGVIFGGLPKLLFGKAAALIVVMVLMLVVFMIVTGTTLLGIYVFIKDSINKARDIKIKSEPEDVPTENSNRFQSENTHHKKNSP